MTALELTEQMTMYFCMTQKEIAVAMGVSLAEAEDVRSGWLDKAVDEAEKAGLTLEEITAATVAAEQECDLGPRGAALRAEEAA